jgi:transcriptional regulator with XRE-family HTH domain
MTLAASSPTIGLEIARWRHLRHLSQLDLASECGVSTRHISFVETGRARPSRDMVLHLAEALSVPPRERNALLLSAGFAPVFRETALDAPEMEEVLAALRLLLGHHDPLPAVAFDARWDVVMCNAAYLGLARLLLPDNETASLAPLTLLAAPRPNILRLLCRPDGARRHIANWPEVVQAILFRVRREVARDTDRSRRALLAEVLAYPGMPDLETNAPDRPPALIVPVEIAGRRFLSTIGSLGTAQDITLQELRIEMFHPVG